MTLKDEWKDLVDTTDGTDGDAVTAGPINLIAHACIALEKAVKALQEAGVDVDLSDYYDKLAIDNLLKKKEDVSNKITLEEWNKSTNRPSLHTDKRYLSASLAYSLHEILLTDIDRFTEKIAYKQIADDEIPEQARYYSAKVTDEKLTTKEDKTTFIYFGDGNPHLIAFPEMYKSEIRIQNAPAISLEFYDGEYEPDYISGLSFDSGETPTRFDYTYSGIINWVGTDCSIDTYTDNEGVEQQISKFQPSSNTHYDIIFYFNGVQFIGLVNGFVPATRNVVSE